MKTTRPLIILYVLLASFLVGGIVLANDSRISDSVSSDSALEAPRLAVTITGRKVTLSWNKVTGATDYEVHYAQKPYDNPDTIKTIDVGNKLSASYEPFPGSAYHVAVKACADASGFNCSDYSIIHNVVIPLVSTFKNSLGQEFKLIPAGTFMMGSPPSEEGRSTEETQHQVTLTKSFYMQTTEVTQAQWPVMWTNPSHFSECSTCPVEQVSWNDVQSYITQMNLRGEGTYSLPTEAQWEYAARAGSTTAFYNGGITEIACDVDPDPNLNAIGWDCNNSDGRTHPVGKKKPNAWGLYDMSGNVWEWCQDWYGSYPTSAATDPTGPSTGSQRVVRGGGFPGNPFYCRSADRRRRPPEDARWIGFRLALTFGQE